MGLIELICEKKEKGATKKWGRGKRKGKWVEQAEHTFVQEEEKQKYFLPVKICDFFFLTGSIFSVIWFDFYRAIVIIWM